MAKRTLQQQLIDALLKRGSVVVPSKTRKYVTLTRLTPTKEGKPTYYFVGKAGALRYGVNSTSSFAASDTFKYKLLCEVAESR